jgi:hypothetical protein
MGVGGYNTKICYLYKVSAGFEFVRSSIPAYARTAKAGTNKNTCILVYNFCNCPC